MFTSRIADAGVAVRVVLHGLPDDIGDFVKAAIVHFFHGMKDAALHGLETVFHGRHGPLKDHVAGVIEKPVLVHATHVVKVMNDLAGGKFSVFFHRFASLLRRVGLSLFIGKQRGASLVRFAEQRTFYQLFRLVGWRLQLPRPPPGGRGRLSQSPASRPAAGSRGRKHRER